MQLVTFKVKSTSFTHLELSLLNLAKTEIQKGCTLKNLALSLTKELESWRGKIAKYRNAPTQIITQSRLISLAHHGKVLVEFHPLA
ncbi:hypothetical protein CLV98_1416 [Dyadobacter jejuensis]|uniref:Uncharacterized protein n=1 Tax=Dyadobacter jejuensis TaxID=1082580 RepID=A0A316A1P2_9BACT|nr:hypothetical protein [Dyadobacter jejuensis]PWJ50624.1 hypothetical protein CLV98_1416 [Dyadobacter jejuensis]